MEMRILCIISAIDSRNRASDGKTIPPRRRHKEFSSEKPDHHMLIEVISVG
jgi:hypothetical protein